VFRLKDPQTNSADFSPSRLFSVEADSAPAPSRLAIVVSGHKLN
jgi:hypothetical protein